MIPASCSTTARLSCAYARCCSIVEATSMEPDPFAIVPLLTRAIGPARQHKKRSVGVHKNANTLFSLQFLHSHQQATSRMVVDWKSFHTARSSEFVDNGAAGRSHKNQTRRERSVITSPTIELAAPPSNNTSVRLVGAPVNSRETPE